MAAIIEAAIIEVAYLEMWILCQPSWLSTLFGGACRATSYSRAKRMWQVIDAFFRYKHDENKFVQEEAAYQAEIRDEGEHAA
eukprot:COSAG01_NODE_69140_length_262_cov_0.638037_1_plen_82_part_10